MNFYEELFLPACQNNDLDRVKAFLKGLNVNVNTLSEDGQWSGVTIAAKQNYIELLDLLLCQPGVDANLPTTESVSKSKKFGKWTPLMFACRAGHHKIVRRLVQVPGINITHKDSYGRTALHVAALKGHSDCLEELAKVPGLDWNCRDSDWTPLFEALSHGRPDCVRIIVSQPGVDLSVKTHNGTTLTEIAVQSTRGDPVECVKIMAEVAAVDWNVKMKNGDTPIMWCLNNDKNDMFNVLLKCPRVDLNPAAVWAAKNDKMDILKEMIATRRVDLNMKDAAGNTPILSALRNKKRKLPADLQDLYLESMEKRIRELEKSRIPECPVRIIGKIQNFFFYP